MSADRNQSKSIKENIKKNKKNLIIGSVGGVPLTIGIGKFVFTLDASKIKYILSTVKRMFANNLSIIIICICVIVVIRLIINYEKEKLNTKEKIDQSIIELIERTVDKGTNMEIKSDKDGWSFSKGSDKEKSKPPDNLYVMEGGKDRNDINREANQSKMKNDVI